jgi:DNA-binding CsgD family transcriptional regulator
MSRNGRSSESLRNANATYCGEMAQGKSNQAISESRFISESAVEKHISAIFRQGDLESSDATVNCRVAAGPGVS